MVLKEDDLKLLQAPGFSLTPQDRETVVKEWIKNSLLYLAAIEEGLDKEPSIRKRLEWSKIMYLAQEYLTRKMEGISIKEEEVDSLFELKKPYFGIALNLLLIFSRDSLNLVEIKEKIAQKGRKLEKVLKELEKNSELSIIETDLIDLPSFLYEFEIVPKGMEKDLTEMEVGEVRGPFASHNGFVLMKVLEKKSKEVNEEEAKGLLRQVIFERKREELEDSLLSYLMKKYKVLREE